MRRIIKSLTLRMAALAVLAAFACVPDAGARMRGDFDAADANHDGKVTLQEYQSYATGRLMEANGRLAQKFKQLSPQEQAARIQQRFEKADHGHKGYLDHQDWDGS
jgi:Ca2+-binding EF-hand superfamily protein